MTRFVCAAVLAAVALPLSSTTTARGAEARAAGDGFIGRWDLTVQAGDRTLPSWLEIRKSGRATLVGQYVGPVGSARPIAKIEVAGDAMRFTIPPQWEQEEGDIAVEARLTSDRLEGTVTLGDGKRMTWTGRRAPAMRRDRPPVWGAPIRLFNGRDLTGWHAFGGENEWRAENGILRNLKGGGNLATDRKFTDFKLHLEFRYPKGSNSGVYLRGRHEVQIVDSVNVAPSAELLGAVYGFLAPTEIVARSPGTWQTYDITLVGRMVTVVANGKTVICNREIPGITGGALDSDEDAPGPLFLQGDHGPVEYRNITLTPAK
jgi:hypothetical protein